MSKGKKTADIISIDDAIKSTRKEGKDKPSKEITYPDAPDILHDSGWKYWEAIQQAYESSSDNTFITQLEQYALARYCNWLAHYEVAEKEVNKTGATQTTDNGYEAVTGSFTVLERVDSRLAKLERQLGFTPAARRAIIGGHPSQGDLFGKELESL